MHRAQLRQRTAVVVARALLDPHVHQILGDLGAQRLEGRIVIDGGAIARPRQVDDELASERRAGSDGQRNDPIGEEKRLVDVVGDEDDGLLVLLPDPLDLVLELGAGQRVERRQGLVEQQHFRAHGQGPGDADALAHAAGELGRTAVAGVAQADHVDVFGDAGLALGGGVLGEHLRHRQLDVAVDGEPGHQRIGLEHQAALGAGRRDGFAVHQHFAAVWLHQTGDGRDQRRLAGAGEAEDGDEFAFA